MAEAINTAGELLRYVFVELPRCPACGSADLETVRTEKHDGVKSHRKKCQTCGHKFFVVFE